MKCRYYLKEVKIMIQHIHDKIEDYIMFLIKLRIYSEKHWDTFLVVQMLLVLDKRLRLEDGYFEEPHIMFLPRTQGGFLGNKNKGICIWASAKLRTASVKTIEEACVFALQSLPREYLPKKKNLDILIQVWFKMQFKSMNSQSIRL